MRLLLDTHALLWALSAPSKLPLRASAALRAPENDVFVSAASVWEIAIKATLGKLSADIDEIVRTSIEVGFEELAVTMVHARRVRSLPDRHRDPFDRMLVAQALEEGMTVVTHDAQVIAYGAPSLWD
ncbi:MAG: type II toxin-antitoxin system VapC family toxin [Myxococcales bacterium]|nr:type II toxin-antitoxin system VapC family toxin [Myxococcales bacterium]